MASSSEQRSARKSAMQAVLTNERWMEFFDSYCTGWTMEKKNACAEYFVSKAMSLAHLLAITKVQLPKLAWGEKLSITEKNVEITSEDLVKFEEGIDELAKLDEAHQLEIQPPSKTALDTKRAKVAFELYKKFIWYTKDSASMTRTTTGTTSASNSDEWEWKVETGRIKTCITVLDATHAVTAHHCLFQESQEWARREGLEFTTSHEDIPGQKKKMRVIECDKTADYVLLELDDEEEPFNDVPKSDTVPATGDEFIIIGYPVDQFGQQEELSFFPGWVSQSRVEPLAGKWNALGLFGTRKGCSGGGAFRYNGKILGICVAGLPPAIPPWLPSYNFLHAFWNSVGSEPAQTCILPMFVIHNHIAHRKKLEEERLKEEEQKRKQEENREKEEKRAKRRRLNEPLAAAEEAGAQDPSWDLSTLPIEMSISGQIPNVLSTDCSEADWVITK